MSPSLQRAARRLVWLLRHGARASGLDQDPAGFVDVGAVCAMLSQDPGDLAEIIAADKKSRFERRGDRLRAAQGQSWGPEGVSPEALEASWDLYAGEGPLWHGTRPEAIPGIAREGILPMARTHVHLATSLHSAVGKRAGTPITLGVSPALLAVAGYPVFLSANGVALVRRVPVEAVVELRGPDAEALAALFSRPIRVVEVSGSGGLPARPRAQGGPPGDESARSADEGDR